MFTLNHWTEKDYTNLLIYIKENADLEYQKFNSNLVNSNYPIIGVRMPILRQIAKGIAKGNYLDYFKLNNYKVYEEIMIRALVITNIKENIDFIDIQLVNLMPHVDNWAVVDSLAIHLKIFRNNQEVGFNLIYKYIESNDPFTIRLGLILLISYYINDNYIDKAIEIITSIKSDNYYVKMANAWLISMCFIKYPDLIKGLFKTNKLDKWTHNKAISKIRDSYRVSIEEKNDILNYKCI